MRTFDWFLFVLCFLLGELDLELGKSSWRRLNIEILRPSLVARKSLLPS